MTTIDAQKFWNLIDLVKPQKLTHDLGGAASDEQLEALETALKGFTDQEIIDFHRIYSQKLHALDTPEFYNNCRVGGLEASADVFLYARANLLSLGQKKYEEVLQNPSTFPEDLWFEDVLSIVADAYFDIYEKYPNADATPSYESFSNEAWSGLI